MKRIGGAATQHGAAADSPQGRANIADGGHLPAPWRGSLRFDSDA